MHVIGFRDSEVAILIYNALRLRLKSLNDVIRPPLPQITIFVVLSTYRLMCQFLTCDIIDIIVQFIEYMYTILIFWGKTVTSFWI